MGRIPETVGPDREIQITYIRPHHREIARRMVLGETSADLCRSLNMSASHMTTIVNSEIFKLELMRLEDQRERGVFDVAKTLTHLAPIALEKVERTMHQSTDEKLATQCAFDILDRAGFKPNQNINLNHKHTVDLSQLSDSEKKELIVQRMGKMKAAGIALEEEQNKANAITIEAEHVESTG